MLFDNLMMIRIIMLLPLKKSYIVQLEFNLNDVWEQNKMGVKGGQCLR